MWLETVRSHDECDGMSGMSGIGGVGVFGGLLPPLVYSVVVPATMTTSITMASISTALHRDIGLQQKSLLRCESCFGLPLRRRPVSSSTCRTTSSLMLCGCVLAGAPRLAIVIYVPLFDCCEGNATLSREMLSYVGGGASVSATGIVHVDLRDDAAELNRDGGAAELLPSGPASLAFASASADTDEFSTNLSWG